MHSLSSLLAISLLVGCGGRALDVEPNESSVDPVESAPSRLRDATPPKSLTSEMTCADAANAFTTERSARLELRTRYELRSALQGFWADCDGPFSHGFYDTLRGEIGIVVEGDRVDTVVQLQDGTFARQRALGELLVENGSDFVLSTGKYWVYFSANGQGVQVGRTDLGSAGGGNLVRRASPLP